MQQASSNPRWHQSSTNGTVIQQQWNYSPAIPSVVPQPTPAPVARKQIPSRKPVGPAVSMQPALVREDSTATTISRQSVSSASGSISSLPSLSSSATSPLTQGALSHAPNVQYLPPIVKQLPPGWRICNDPTGRMYFLNTVTNQSTWEPPESEVITPNYGLPPTFTPVTYAPVPAPQFHPAPQNPIPSKNAGASFSPSNFNPQPAAQFSPTTTTSQQSQFSSTTTLSPRTSASFVPQPQQFPPTSTFAPQSPSTFEPQSRQISRISTFSSHSPSISPTSEIQWESREPDFNSIRKKSRFSLPKGFNPPKINTAVIKNGAKIAGQTSLKGAKITGKALKNNRKMIGAGVKIANVVLRETTGVSIPGAGLIAGGGDDDDDDGVFAVVGAMGSMIGSGEGDDCDVDIDIDENCEVDAELDEVEVDDEASVEAKCEEEDFYEDQETAEYVDCEEQTMQPAMVQQAQPTARRPQNRKKRPVNSSQRPIQTNNQSKPVGQPVRKGKRPQRPNPSTSGAKPSKPCPSATPLQQNNKPRPNSAPNAIPRKKQSHPSSKQTQPSQSQAPNAGRRKKPRPGGQAQQHSQTTAHVSPSSQKLSSGSDIANSVMRATSQGVSKAATREINRGLIGMFTDDDFEGASDIDDYSDGVEYEEEAESYDEDEDYEEEYENDEVEIYEQQEETMYEEEVDQTATVNETVAICEEETFSETDFQVDYSTFEGYGGFGGGSTSLAGQEETEQTAIEEVNETQTTQVSDTFQQDAFTEDSYTVDAIETSETFQQQACTEEIYTSQDTQVSEYLQQEAVTDENYAEEYIQTSEQSFVQEETTYTQVDQTAFQAAVENSLPNQEVVVEETLQTWDSTIPAEPPLWAQENAILEENVWAAEPANFPPADEDPWAQTETCVAISETTQQSSFQEETIYSEMSFAQGNNVQQESIVVESTTYAESNTIFSQDFSQEAVICNESTVVESSMFQGPNQELASNETIIVEDTVASGSSQEIVTETAICEITNSTTVEPFQEAIIYGETNIREEAIVVQPSQQQTANFDAMTYGETTFIDCGMIQEPQHEIVGSETILVEETQIQQEVIATETVAYTETNATMSAPFQGEFFYEETNVVAGPRIEVATGQEESGVETAVSHELEATTDILETSQTTSEQTSFIVETGVNESASFQGTAQNNTPLVAASTTVETSHAHPVIFEEPPQGVFCVETEIQASSTTNPICQAEVRNYGSRSHVEVENVVAERPPQQRQGSSFSVETGSIGSSTQRESIHEEAFIIETASCVEMSSVVPSKVQHSGPDIASRGPTPIQIDPPQIFVIEDTTRTEPKSIEPIVAEIPVQNELVSVRSTMEDSSDATAPVVSQEGSLKGPISIDTVSIVVSPPEETADLQSWIIEDVPHTETRVVQQNSIAPLSDCDEAIVIEETFASQKNPVSSDIIQPQKTPASNQVFAIDAGSNVVLQNSTPAVSQEELLIKARSTCPTPEEEMPYNSPLSNPHRDEHELFFNIPSKQPTEEREIVAQARARKNTLASEQLKEFIQSQALIFQAASIIEKTTAEPDTVGGEQVNAEKPIPIPPPPPYPPPLRLPSRSSWTVPNPFPPPEVPLKIPHESPSHVSQEPPKEPTPPPTKTLTTILSEAATAANSTPVSTSSQPVPLDPDIVFELPALNDAREEPNIIDMTPQEQFAMAMFASGDFLGDDLGFEEGNMLPEVRVG